MLSDCRGCKYFQLDGCAVNPGYWKVERLVRPNLTPGELNAAQMMLLPCPNWEKAMVPHYYSSRTFRNSLFSTPTARSESGTTSAIGTTTKLKTNMP